MIGDQMGKQRPFNESVINRQASMSHIATSVLVPSATHHCLEHRGPHGYLAHMDNCSENSAYIGSGETPIVGETAKFRGKMKAEQP